MSGLRFRREVSCDQNRGIEPRFWTTELIRVGNPSGTSSNIICSVSTSFATLPLSFTPRFRYLYLKKKKIQGSKVAKEEGNGVEEVPRLFKKKRANGTER